MSTLLYLIPALICVAGAIFFFQGFNFKGKVIKSKVIAIILGVMFFVAVNKFNEENNPTPPTPKVEKTPERVSTEPKPNWSYTSTEVGIDKEKMSFITTKSKNSLNLEFPYQGTNYGELTIRKSKNGTELLFSVDKGQIMCNFSDCSGKIKFDSAPSTVFYGSEPSDRTSTLIFIQNPNGFIQKIKNAKKVFIEVEFFRQGKQTLEFDVEGLDLTRK